MFHTIPNYGKSIAMLHIYNLGGAAWSHSLNLKTTKAFIPRLLRTGSSGEGDTNNKNSDSPIYKQDIVGATKKWVDMIVVGEELCPFVKRLKESNSIRYVLSKAINIEQAVEDFAGEAKILLKDYKKARSKSSKFLDDTEGLIIHQPPEINSVKPKTHDVTLISFHGPFVKDFNDFDVLCEQVNHNVLIEMKFFDILTVMNFHPTYISYYDKRPKKVDDSFYYPRRSPFPTMVLIQERDMQSAFEIDNIEELCSRNKIKFIDQGLRKCQKRLESCYKVETNRK